MIDLDPYPLLDGKGLHYPYVCSSESDWEWPAWYRLRCRGRVELRTAGSRHRLLASGRLRALQSGDRRWTGLMDARLFLTALGRARMARTTPSRARVRFIGRHVPTDGWMIRLAGRRAT
jgi:hypothetical protein